MTDDESGTPRQRKSRFQRLLQELADEHERELKTQERRFEIERNLLQAALLKGDETGHLPEDGNPCAYNFDETEIHAGYQPGVNRYSEVSQLTRISMFSQPRSSISRNSYVDRMSGLPEVPKPSPPPHPASAKSRQDGKLMGQTLTSSTTHGALKTDDSFSRDVRKTLRNQTHHSRMSTLYHIRPPALPLSSNVIQRIVFSQYFDLVSGFAIMVNAVMLGVSSDYYLHHCIEMAAGTEDYPLAITVIENFFSFWFLIEVSLRFVAEGVTVFFCSYTSPWNYFDVLLVGTDVFELIFKWTAGQKVSVGSVSIMRMLRVLRVARALRIVRLISFCKDLRMMILSILKSGTSLMWSMALLFMIIYVFGIYVVQAVAVHISDGGEMERRTHFTSLARVLYVLFMCISGGISWGEVNQPLIDIHWTNGLVIVFFIFFSIFAMLNIVTGIFVDTAFKAVNDDNDQVIQAELSSKNSTLKRLEAIFRKADSDNSGTISLEEFENLLDDDNARALMSTVGLDIYEARSMFSLLDHMQTGEVEIEEFLVGCLRLKGQAKSSDLVTLMYENRCLMDMMKNFAAYAEGEFAHGRRFQAALKLQLQAVHANGNLQRDYAVFEDGQVQEKISAI